MVYPDRDGGGRVTESRHQWLRSGSTGWLPTSGAPGESFSLLTLLLPFPVSYFRHARGNLSTPPEISGRFTSGWEMRVAKYMNWWPARPVMAGAIARRVSFQIDLAWNFLEAHHESNLKVTHHITSHHITRCCC